MHKTISAVLLSGLLWSQLAGTVYAYDPDGVAAWPLPAFVCNERVFLAQVLVTESNAQPDAAHWAIASIVYREALSRNMSVCELAMQTRFLAVWHWAEAHPGGWMWRQFREYPPDWATEIAATVLLGREGDVRGEAMHFGACSEPQSSTLWKSGQICFSR